MREWKLQMIENILQYSQHQYILPRLHHFHGYSQKYAANSFLTCDLLVNPSRNKTSIFF